MDKTEFTIKNLNREKIFKEIIKITNIYNVKYNEQNISFCVNKKDEKKVQKLLEKKYININNKKNKGFFTFFKKNILKIGIILPIFIFLVVLFVLNNFVFMYQIQGIELISNEEVISILKNQNIYNFTPKNAINLNKIENEILKLDKASLVSAIIKGNTLIINIKEKVYNEEYENKDNFAPILAKYDGTITEISVVQGTPLVKVGQTVKCGQELVAPYVIDTSGNKLAISPLADIKADVFFTTLTNISDTALVLEDTGNTFTKHQIMLGSNIIYDDNLTCEYKHYKTEVKKEYIAENNILPLAYITTTFIEQKQVEYTNYFKTNQEQIIANCKQKTRQMLGSCDIIKDEYYTVSFDAGIYRVTYTVVSNTTI